MNISQKVFKMEKIWTKGMNPEELGICHLAEVESDFYPTDLIFLAALYRLYPRSSLFLSSKLYADRCYHKPDDE